MEENQVKLYSYLDAKQKKQEELLNDPLYTEKEKNSIRKTIAILEKRKEKLIENNGMNTGAGCSLCGDEQFVSRFKKSIKAE